jgi:hypothetical protein
MALFSATALQSLEIASDTILSGKAKVMIAGGFDDISEEGSYEFANMKATSNAETEFAMGREPTEMSRPATTSRAGVSNLMFCFPRSLIGILVHGSSRNWCPYRHECEDCTRSRLSYSGNSGIHFYVNVS